MAGGGGGREGPSSRRGARALSPHDIGMDVDHEEWMRRAIAEGELARGTTGDNPWVGCVIFDPKGALLARGHTQGPGEDHAEIAAVREAHALGRTVVGSTMYSTL